MYCFINGYGERTGNCDLTTFVPKVDVVELDCGHWIADERPAETTRVILDWLRHR